MVCFFWTIENLNEVLFGILSISKVFIGCFGHMEIIIRCLIYSILSFIQVGLQIKLILRLTLFNIGIRINHFWAVPKYSRRLRFLTTRLKKHLIVVISISEGPDHSRGLSPIIGFIVWDMKVLSNEGPGFISITRLIIRSISWAQNIQQIGLSLEDIISVLAIGIRIGIVSIMNRVFFCLLGLTDSQWLMLALNRAVDDMVCIGHFGKRDRVRLLFFGCNPSKIHLFLLVCLLKVVFTWYLPLLWRLRISLHWVSCQGALSLWGLLDGVLLEVFVEIWEEGRTNIVGED